MKIRTHVAQRGLIALVACLLLGLACSARALAIMEYCPAGVDMQPVGVAASSDGAPAPAALYSFVLSAESERAVTGAVMVQTDGAWFSVPFSNVALNAYTERWRDPYLTFTRVGYYSDVLYVRFPHPVVALSSFVRSVSTKGEVAFGWDAKGRVSCWGTKGASIISTDPKLAYRAKPSRGGVEWLNPIPASTAAPATDTPLITASLTNEPGPTDCAVPFEDAVVTKPVAPDFPFASRGESSMTIIQVAISATGKLDDAWVWVPSGDERLDQAALESAKKSTYRPARSFCADAPGMYLFRAQFRSP